MTGKAGLAERCRPARARPANSPAPSGAGAGHSEQVADAGEAPVLPGQAERQPGDQQRRGAGGRQPQRMQPVTRRIGDAPGKRHRQRRQQPVHGDVEGDSSERARCHGGPYSAAGGRSYPRHVPLPPAGRAGGGGTGCPPVPTPTPSRMGRGRAGLRQISYRFRPELARYCWQRGGAATAADTPHSSGTTTTAEKCWPQRERTSCHRKVVSLAVTL